ncbi:hypothetical protein DesyoDRAFT_1094 [Desulfosporosinus youngiae DSM 17734]|uniref:Uncharacterized protein n=1 Tax=Desulfosporosinus youngiae DSM 17734 TaxID=768710 RepID=H5Y266_9FIRM|nr:hypothetical protein DesyoDRAFT_1094 [Desulfosporosinus youngiae DSM 17734]
MCTVGEIVRYKQPEVLRRLANIKDVKKHPKSKKVNINDHEAEQLMRHDGYERRRGGIRQTRRA